MRKRNVTIWLVAAIVFMIGLDPAEGEPTGHCTLVRVLNLQQPTVKGLPCHLAAASGLALSHGKLLVIADDALSLAIFEGQEPGRLYPLLERPPLPLDPKERKRAKPDLEACALVQECDQEALLILGSGSRTNRRVGVYVTLDETGEPREARAFDLSALYCSLGKEFPDLNIEGACVSGNRLLLAQRGNRKGGANAIIELDLGESLGRAAQGKSWEPELVRRTRKLELGSTPGLQGPVPFTLTDLAPLSDGSCLFTAAAEDTANPVDDGRVLGSAVGVLGPQGDLLRLVRLDTPLKCEGITGRLTPEGVEIWMVTDADDPWQPSRLLRLLLPHLQGRHSPACSAQSSSFSTASLVSARRASSRASLTPG